MNQEGSTETPEVPVFMAEDIPAKKPELDRAALSVGDTVIVVEPRYRGNNKTTGTVISKARVWIEVEAPAIGLFKPKWRFRLDSQTDGSDSHYSIRFQTPDQYRFYMARDSAANYLKEQGIDPDYRSPWRDRVVELARIIWTASQPSKAE